ncbi:MAG: sulfurtransferase TusA family protein [Candidatus Bathyarchaeia archaeon]
MPVRADEVLDVRGKSCPFPVLMTRDQLRKMKGGEILEVVENYPQSKDNIRRFAEKHGHKVLSVIKEKAYYRIFIRRK